MISLKGILGKKDDAPKDAPKPETTGSIPTKQISESTSGSVFGKALNQGQMKQSKKDLYIQAKEKKKAYMVFGSSFLVLAVYSVVFFYGNASDYIKAPSQIRSLNAEIQEYEEVIIPSLENTKDLHKTAYDKEFEEVIDALDTVFPEEIDKLSIIRLFESFATEVDASFPPFEFTSINLSAPQQKEGYTVVPASTSIHSSLAGFDKFLSLVDKSGYIYSEEGEERALLEKMVRLMGISNISVKYRGVDESTGKDGGVDFSVKLNIYSRPETNTNK